MVELAHDTKKISISYLGCSKTLGATPPPAGLGRTAVTCTGDLESSPLHIWGTRDDHDLKAAWVLSNKEGLVAHFPPASDSS